MKKIIFITYISFLFTTVHYSQNVYSSANANIVIAEGENFKAITVSPGSILDVVQGENFSVLISEFNFISSEVSTSVEFQSSSAKAIKAYPNPFHSFVTLDLELEKAEKLTIQMISINGQNVLIKKVNDPTRHYKEKIWTDELIPGQYFIIMHDDEGKVMGRVSLIKM